MKATPEDIQKYPRLVIHGTESHPNLYQDAPELRCANYEYGECNSVATTRNEWGDPVCWECRRKGAA
jgi:hypothetical protein